MMTGSLARLLLAAACLASTVASSLAGDIELRSVLVLNGERGELIEQPMFSATFPATAG